MCGKILQVWPAMRPPPGSAARPWVDPEWTFVDVEGVEPTNNFAERVLRIAVLWRKRSFGTQSEEDSRFVERLLTVSVTLRLQGRDPVYPDCAWGGYCCLPRGCPDIIDCPADMVCDAAGYCSPPKS